MDWPFDDEQDVVCLTVRQILGGQSPIFAVHHDADEGMWQFLTGGEFVMDDAMLVSLKSVYALDPSIGDVANLPIGWSAELSGRHQPWTRYESVDEAAE